MPKTLIKSRLHSNKHKPKIKQQINNTKSNLPPHLQSFKQKLLSGNGFVEYKQEYLNIYEYLYLDILTQILVLQFILYK